MPSYKAVDDIDVPLDFTLPEVTDRNLARGRLLFKKHCAQCHAITRNIKNPQGSLLGPNLYGVMGRTAAQNQRTGWSRYSQTLEESGILWTDRNMIAFLKNPKAFAGGAVNMNFRGIDSFQDRVDLVHYLKRAGHEKWMEGGVGHTQKGWWSRKRGTRREETSLEAFGSFAKEKAGVLLGRAGMEPEPSYGGSLGTLPADDPELQKWRRVHKVVDGVRAGSMQQSFNWPPPEVIAEGPTKRSSQASSEDSPLTRGMSTLAACEEHDPGKMPPLPGGTRAPSGLMVYAESGGPLAHILLAKPKA